jgi:membrane protein implicated in regulation of membrane protease activity
VFDSILMSLAVTMPDLTILYWICMIVGGSLLVLSMVGAAEGDADVDFDADVSLDADVDVEVDADVDADFDADVSADHVGAGHGGVGSLATWLSVRFLVYFVAVFGVLGVVFTYLTSTGRSATLGVAVLGGMVAGQGVHQLFRKLKQTSGNSTPTVSDYVNKIGRVSIPVTSEQKGEIALRVRRSDRYIPALAKHADATFKAGDEVAVVDYRGGVAEVISRQEFEFLTNKN